MDFSKMTRDALRKRAAEAQIPGRSKMNKAELAEALEYTHTGECTPESKDTGVRAVVTRDIPGSGYVNLDTVQINTAVFTRRGRRWELRAATGAPVTIRARSIAKAVKAWAARMGIMLDGIETTRQF